MSSLPPATTRRHHYARGINCARDAQKGQQRDNTNELGNPFSFVTKKCSAVSPSLYRGLGDVLHPLPDAAAAIAPGLEDHTVLDGGRASKKHAHNAAGRHATRLVKTEERVQGSQVALRIVVHDVSEPALGGAVPRVPALRAFYSAGIEHHTALETKTHCIA